MESLFDKVNVIESTMTKFQANVDEMLKKDPQKDAAAKKAMEEKEENDKKEAKKAKRASLEAAIRKAMEEPEDEKKDAAIKKAMHDYDEEHKGMENNHDKPDQHEAFGPRSDKDNEHTAAVHDIIDEKKADLIKNIMTANIILNPTKLKEVEARVRQASISELKQEWGMVEGYVASIQQQPSAPQPTEKVIPFFANYQDPTAAQIDSKQLNASSPDSAFASLSTKELMRDDE